MAEIGTELWVCASAVAQAVQKIENQVAREYISFGSDLATALIFKKICSHGRYFSPLNPLFLCQNRPHKMDDGKTLKMVPVSPFHSYRLRRSTWDPKIPF